LSADDGLQSETDISRCARVSVEQQDSSRVPSSIAWTIGFQTGVRGPKGVRDGFPGGPREDSEK